jgi:nucleoside-diphosphate-sugar epimerase
MISGFFGGARQVDDTERGMVCTGEIRSGRQGSSQQRFPRPAGNIRPPDERCLRRLQYRGFVPITIVVPVGQMTGQTVLLTGATGFLGGATAAELVSRHPTCQLLLLVRNRDEAPAAIRVRRSLARFVDAESVEAGLSHCTIVEGDLTDPATLADPRLDAATHVLHLAANTSFRSIRSVRQVNIFGTLALAERLRRMPSLRRFLHVGTAYICGADPPRLVHEDDYPRPNVRHLAEYTASKAECEMLLEQTVPELPLIVARPSVVVGHSRLGCLPSASIFWYYRTLDLLRRSPGPLDRRRDIVSVDYTASALVHLLGKPDLRHRRYHISAGEAANVSWREIATEFAACYGERAEEPYRVVDFAELVSERDRIRRILGNGDDEKLLRAVEAYFRFGVHGPEAFDNRRLLEEGMLAPRRFTDWLRVCATLPANASVYRQMLDDF